MSDDEWEMIEEGGVGTAPAKPRNAAATPEPAPEPSPPPKPEAWSSAPFACLERGTPPLRTQCAGAAVGTPEAVGLCTSVTLLHLGAGLTVAPLAALFSLLLGVLGVRRRAQFRRRWGLPARRGQPALDCALYALCAPCAVAQEQRHAQYAAAAAVRSTGPLVAPVVAQP